MYNMNSFYDMQTILEQFEELKSSAKRVKGPEQVMWPFLKRFIISPFKISSKQQGVPSTMNRQLNLKAIFTKKQNTMCY